MSALKELQDELSKGVENVEGWALAIKDKLPAAAQAAAQLEASPIALEPKLDGVQQVLVSKGLGQKLHRTSFHCLYRHRYVTVPSYKNDRKSDPARSKFSLKIEAALPRQPNVKDKA